MQKTKKRRLQVAVIGRGRVGTSIAKALVQSGRQFELFAHLGARSKSLRQSQARGGPDILILATRDSSITSVARRVVPHCGPNLKIAAHCAGSIGPDAIGTKKQIATATFHPLQTFAKADPKLLHGINITISTTDKSAEKVLRKLASELGAKYTLFVRPDDLPLYHAAAVFGANFPVLLGTVVEEIARKMKVSERAMKQALRPIMLQAVENLLSRNSRDVLTGPLARADQKTIAAHQKALQGFPPVVLQLYGDFVRLSKEYRLYGGAK